MRLESLKARIVVHEKNEAIYEEDIAFLKYDVQVKDISIKDLKNQLEEALKEKDDLKLKLEIFEESSKNLTKLINSQISAKDKTGLGYHIQMNESEVVYSVFDSRESDVDDSLVNNRFKTSKGFPVVPPPYIENYMPSRPDLSIARLDDSVYKTKMSETETSISKTSKDIIEKPKINRVLVTKPHNKTPYELLHGRPPSISFMRPFGCPMTILNTLAPLGKFDGKADEGFLVGYSINSKAFRVFNTRTRKVEENLHKTFLENKPNVAGSGPNWLFDFDLLTNSMNYEPVTTGNQTNKNAEDAIADDAGKKTNEEPANKGERNGQEKEGGASNKEDDHNVQDFRAELDNLLDTDDLLNTGIFNGAYDDEDEGAEADLNNLETTMNKPKKVIQTLDDPIWIEVMQEELLQFRLQKVWTLVDLPNGKRAIGTKWVYRNKKDERGIVVRNKARLVAQGYTQEKGINYDEVFAPAARIEVIRLFFAYASFMGFIVYQMDVKSDFLYGTIEEEVYVCQPPGFEDPQFPDKVYKVEKALYGLHQAPRVWYETLSTYLLENRFKRGTIDKTLFIKKDKGDILLVQVYVDDIIFGSTNKSLCVEFEQMLHKRFQMSFMGSMIRSFMYLTASRLDIMFVVCACARFQVTPKVSHLHAVKMIFRYLKGQPKLELWYPRDSPFHLEAFFDNGISNEFGVKTGSCKVNAARQDLVLLGEREDYRVERDATTAASLDVEQDSGNILKTQSTAIPSVPLSQGIGTSSSPRCQEAMGGPLHRLGLRGVLALETSKTAQDLVINKLKKKVKRLEKKQRARTPGMKLFKVGTSRRKSLDKENVSKQGRNLKTRPMFKEGDFDDDINDMVNEAMKNVEGDTVNADGAINTATIGVSAASASVTTTGVSISTVKPRRPPTATKTAFEDEDLTISQTLVKMRSEKAKVKGVDFRDVEKSSRSTTILPTIDPNDKGKGIMQEPEKPL
ncbi:putative ribonuclease H-like domain-containing protein, partial [Tanacetum coccineum]